MKPNILFKLVAKIFARLLHGLRENSYLRESCIVTMLKILKLASFLTTFCTLVFISSSFAAERPLSKFAIKRLQTIVNEQGYEVSVNGRLDTKTNGLIRKIFKKNFPDKNFSYKKFFSLKKQTKVRDNNFNYEKFTSREQSKINAAKQAAAEEDLFVKNLFINYASIAKNNKNTSLASQKSLKLENISASKIPAIYFSGPSSISNSDTQFLTDKYGNKFTDILISATENNDVNALIILVKIYSILSNREKLDSSSRLSLIARWTAQAAKAGDLQSIVNLGHIVDDGRGVVASGYKALKIYQYARDQGFKGAILKLDKAIAKKELEQRKAIAKKELEQRRELELKASRDAPPTTKAITKLVSSAVIDIMCTKRNHFLGAAKSGSVWNMIIARSPGTMRRVGNQCVLKHLAGNYVLSVNDVRNINCNKTGAGYVCSFGFSMNFFGPGMEFYDRLLSLSKIVQPAMATLSIREGRFYPIWKISNFEMIGSAKGNSASKNPAEGGKFPRDADIKGAMQKLASSRGLSILSFKLTKCYRKNNSNKYLCQLKATYKGNSQLTVLAARFANIGGPLWADFRRGSNGWYHVQSYINCTIRNNSSHCELRK